MKPVADAGAHAAPKEPLSLEAFLQRYDDTHAEWVNGEAIPKTPASVEHQRTSGFLLGLLVNWLAYHNLGEVYPDKGTSVGYKKSAAWGKFHPL